MKRKDLAPAFGGAAENKFINSFISGCSAGNDKWRDDTLRKISRGRETFGDYEYLNRTVSSMVEEIYEELQDLGGWSCVAALTVHAKMKDESLSCDNAGLLLSELSNMARAGAELSKALDQLRELAEND